MDARDKFADELQKDQDTFYQSGRNNNLLDVGLSVLTVLASLVATVLSGAKVDAIWVAIAAATPAATTTIQRAVNLRGRSGWYFRMGSQLRALEMKVKYDQAQPLADLAHKRAEIELAMDPEWARVVAGGAIDETTVKKS